MTQELHVVLGAGPLGRSVFEALTAQGKPTRVVNRSGRVAGAPESVEWMTGDLTSPADLDRLFDGATHIYQCSQPAYENWLEEFVPMQAGMVDAAARAGAKLILGDNLYMYGPVDGPVTESLPYQHIGKKVKARALMAEYAFEAHAAGKVQVTAGRASDFFGPWVLSSAAGDRVFPALLDGKAAQFIGPLDVPHTWNYINDFGRALVGSREAAFGRAWHLPGTVLTQRQFAEKAAEAAGVEAKVSTMPPFMFNLLKRFVPILRELEETAYQFAQPFVVDASDFEETFGMTATPIEEALKDTVDWYRGR